jgi:hypothetical protein
MSKYLKKIRRQQITILSITVLVYLGQAFCGYLNYASYPGKRIAAEKKFAGSAACAACHSDLYKSHIQTAHYLDSRPAAPQFIKGSFAPGKNKFAVNKWSEVVLEKKGDRLFQTAVINGVEMQQEPFDIVIGSGRKGQTYLYWNGNDLFQLPVSYYTPMDSWCNSPGFTNNYVRFNRPVSAQCLECHSTYAKEALGNINTFEKDKIIFGIDCERCHGPASAHVSFHQQHPEEKTGRHIINTSNMDRQIRLDACALCHSGFRSLKQPPFSFEPGSRLDDYSTANYDPDSVATLDVHGNQYGLLTASKCFKASSQMDCSSCHDPHRNEFNDKKTFSVRCMTCHEEGTPNFCKIKAEAGLKLSDNCIDCHMPLLPSGNIQLNVANAGKLVPDMVRTHRVAIYAGKTNEFMNRLKVQKK